VDWGEETGVFVAGYSLGILVDTMRAYGSGMDRIKEHGNTFRDVCESPRANGLYPEAVDQFDMFTRDGSFTLLHSQDIHSERLSPRLQEQRHEPNVYNFSQHQMEISNPVAEEYCQFCLPKYF
jgi:hypothetical protein